VQVGDLIRDYEFPEDMGIILAFDKVKLRSKGTTVMRARVFCINNGHVHWLPKGYIEKCEVLSASR